MISFAHALTFMRTLSIRVRNWCAPWACASGTDAHPERARQELMRTLSIPISSLRACSACASVEHQLSIQVRKWCVKNWAYASGTNACTECIPFQKCWPYASGTDGTLSIRVRNWCVCWVYESGTDAYPEHTHQFLTCMLSISIKILNLKRSLQSMLSMRVRNWCVHWACASGTDACTERAHQELMHALSLYASGTDAHAQHAHQKLNDA